MQIKNLTVYDGDIEIRNINFLNSFNIITNEEIDGNQIGKSTALRVINSCLGSDGKSIWHDPDSNTTNEKIKKYVNNGSVYFVLLIEVNNIEYRIKRMFLEVEQKTRNVIKIFSWINDDEYNTNKKFKAALSPILGFSLTKPSYSTVKNRFVRLDKTTSFKTYKYLNVNTKDSQYITYYSYLFGFESHNSVAEEMELVKEKSNHEARVEALLNQKTEKEIKNELKSIDDEVDDLNQKEESFDFKDSQNKAIDRLKSCREKIANFSAQISDINIKIDFSNRTISNYERKIPDIDIDQLGIIYEEASSLVSGINKKFSEVVDFHKSIIQKKVNYIEKQLLKLYLEIEEWEMKLNELLDEEKNILKSVSNESHLGGFVVIEKELQDKREQRGRVSIIIDEIKNESIEIKKIELKIDEIRKSYSDNIDQLKANVEIFNKYCKNFTRAIFKDFSLSLNVDIDSSSNEIFFSVVNLEKVQGEGAPRAAALAFDMAFVEFSRNSKQRLPEFTLQDHLESSDQEKLAILASICEKKQIQVIVSMLSDKLQSLSKEFINNHTVLWLKKSDKFFKIG